MSILLSLSDTQIAPWRKAFQQYLPTWDIRVFPKVGQPSDIKYAVVWKHPNGDLKRYQNLKAILSCGAGVDHIINDPDLPLELPIVRLYDEKLTQDMCHYALHWVLHFHNDYAQYTKYQHWQPHSLNLPEERCIGIMGMGNIGAKIALALANLGFNVQGWGATPRTKKSAWSYYYGASTLSSFLRKTDILINVLPLTDQTKGLLDAKQLLHLPRGAYVINMGRGGVIDEDGLLKSLNKNHIQGAALDVFETEPLPTSHPFWRHPNVYVTPHIAGQNNPKTASKAITDNILKIENGQTPFPLYDPNKGY